MQTVKQNPQLQKARIRKELRSQRRALSYAQQLNASLKLAKVARGYRQLWTAKRVLAYSAMGGEINPNILFNRLNSQIYLPKITNYRMGRMQFFSSYGAKQVNRLGILEPKTNSSQLYAHEFDAVLVPLLGFDRKGNRLGMGGGFYDRAFAFKQQSCHRRRPLLIGLAHHFQEVDSIDTQSWDVPLDALISDRELLIF